MVIVYADEEAVGLPISSRVELEAMAATVPLVPALLGVARLAAVTYALPTDRDAQLRLAEEIFGEGPILDRLQAFTRSEKPRGMVFAEQNMFVLLRLLIEHKVELDRDAAHQRRGGDPQPSAARIYCDHRGAEPSRHADKAAA